MRTSIVPKPKYATRWYITEIEDAPAPSEHSFFVPITPSDIANGVIKSKISLPPHLHNTIDSLQEELMLALPYLISLQTLLKKDLSGVNAQDFMDTLKIQSKFTTIDRNCNGWNKNGMWRYYDSICVLHHGSQRTIFYQSDMSSSIFVVLRCFGSHTDDEYRNFLHKHMRLHFGSYMDE